MSRLLASLILLGFLTFTPSPRAAVGPPRSAPRRDTLGESLPPAAVARLGTLRLMQGGSVTALAFSRNGRCLFSTGAQAPLRAWDVVTGQEVLPPGLPTVHAGAMTLSPNGRLLAVACGDNRLRVWDLERNSLFRQLTTGSTPCPALAFTSDSKALIFVAADRTIRVRDLATDRDRLVLKNVSQGTNLLAVAPDGKGLISRSGEGIGLITVLHWDLVRGKRLRRYLHILNDEQFVPITDVHITRRPAGGPGSRGHAAASVRHAQGGKAL